jgi:hypothetical protein
MSAGSQEIQGIKNTLQLIEENNLFARDARLHRVRRQDETDLDIEDDQDVMMEAVAAELVAPEDESRGWKNGGKKKKNKKNKEAAVATENILEAAEATEVAMKENSSPQANSLETEEDAMKGMVAEDKDPFTSGIQFSAYSGGGGEARPTYKPARAAAAAASRPVALAAGPENRFMYGLDRNGNPQFMDEAAVSMLLQNPQAKKVVEMFWKKSS